MAFPNNGGVSRRDDFESMPGPGSKIPRPGRDFFDLQGAAKVGTR
jgi:hypothetical protein